MTLSTLFSELLKLYKKKTDHCHWLSVFGWHTLFAYLSAFPSIFHFPHPHLVTDIIYSTLSVIAKKPKNTHIILPKGWTGRYYTNKATLFSFQGNKAMLMIALSYPWGLRPFALSTWFPLCLQCVLYKLYCFLPRSIQECTFWWGSLCTFRRTVSATLSSAAWLSTSCFRIGCFLTAKKDKFDQKILKQV